jgi:hypothetical protein
LITSSIVAPGGAFIRARANDDHREFPYATIPSPSRRRHSGDACTREDARWKCRVFDDGLTTVVYRR